ncbi:MAG: LysR family transcriptional regulator [Coriobacteriales bacterium]|jgi:DNA-binding transcriptional LysR family regulator|nr:LysR family transcriptional regulator [Coriobacteriales bacterium]
MTLLTLKYFIEAINAGSISLAAKNLFIAQPSLSKALKELEAEVDLQLFIRHPKGISLTDDGAEFLGYARQIVEQATLLEERYSNKAPRRRLCAISAQHYAFVVRAFANMVKKVDTSEYEFTLRETRTHEIFDDVKNWRSEIGVIYTNPFNEKVIHSLLKENRLAFKPLFTAKPHIFTGAFSPLAKKKAVTLDDLTEYPYLSYEQGSYNSFYFSEEMQSTVSRKKNIRVNDRATMFNLMIALNGYTISSGLINSDLNGNDIVAIPLLVDDIMTVGYIVNASISLSRAATLFLNELNAVIDEYGYSL